MFALLSQDWSAENKREENEAETEMQQLELLACRSRTGRQFAARTVTHLLICKRRTIRTKLLPGERCQEGRTEALASSMKLEHAFHCSFFQTLTPQGKRQEVCRHQRAPPGSQMSKSLAVGLRNAQDSVTSRRHTTNAHPRPSHTTSGSCPVTWGSLFLITRGGLKYGRLN